MLRELKFIYVEKKKQLMRFLGRTKGGREGLKAGGRDRGREGESGRGEEGGIPD